MSNPFEAIWNMLKISIDTTNEPKSPLHIIEAGDCWTYLTLMVEFIRYEEAGLNTTTDDEVREMLNDVIQLCESQVQKLNEFMKKEGIPLPDATSAKPNSDPNDIPLGVKLTDDELANGVAFKLVTCLQACSKGQADAIRDDIGIMWLQFYLEWAMFGSTLKTLMRKRGWLKVPPYYYSPGSPK
ncbi:DUF3231 family protein [Bacillus sp. JJ1609]|uniref:DUF3231 family protein n=1 Tax=Bacillus sp. JJ1609 TaxID=3122977 RepID=UPI0030002063